MVTDVAGDGTERHSVAVETTINGEEVTAEVEPRLKLSDFLRERRGLRGVRVGCEHGVCGACTALVDGRAAKTCLMYAAQVDGRDVETVEGLADDGELHPIQEAFHEEHALQCGFCTSGFVMASVELLRDYPNPSREEVKEGLADNICRCTGYHQIYEAVERAADDMAGEAVADGGAVDGGDNDGDDLPESDDV